MSDLHYDPALSTSNNNAFPKTDINGNIVDPDTQYYPSGRPVTVAAISGTENKRYRRPRSRSRNTTTSSSSPRSLDSDKEVESSAKYMLIHALQSPRPCTAGASKPLTRRRDSELDEAARALLEVRSQDLGQRRTEILQKGICGRYNNLPAMSNGNGSCIPAAPSEQNTSSDPAPAVTKAQQSTCDLEFINGRYSYDQAKSVAAFDSSDQPASPTGQELLDDGRDNDNGNIPDVARQSSGTLQRLIDMGQKIFDRSLAKVDLISGASKVGESIYKTGVGVASAFFREQDGMKEDTITYNGFKIHTIGTHLCINSIILRGSKNQRMRIVVQTKDFEGLHHRPPSSNQQASGAEPKIYVIDDKWTLVYGSYEEEDSGVVEIQVPPGVSLRDIKTEGPCKGLIFIDIM